MKQNVAITGSSGLLGQYLCQSLANQYNVTALYHETPVQRHGVNAVKIDLRDTQAIRKLFEMSPPDFVIHTAGLTSVDACEESPSLANQLNVEVTKNVVMALENLPTRLIHLSTDHLFSGTESFYLESSPVTPVNVYAATKYSAENIVSQFSNSVIVRTNFHGGVTAHKKSFSNWIYDELSAGRQINLFNDVFFTPISVCALSENIGLLMSSQLRGIYNIVGSERISKFTFAHLLADFFQLDSELIIQSKIVNASLRARRPRDMSLSLEKIMRDLPGFKPETVSMSFNKIKSQKLI